MKAVNRRLSPEIFSSNSAIVVHKSTCWRMTTLLERLVSIVFFSFRFKFFSKGIEYLIIISCPMDKTTDITQLIVGKNGQVKSLRNDCAIDWVDERKLTATKLASRYPKIVETGLEEWDESSSFSRTYFWMKDSLFVSSLRQDSTPGLNARSQMFFVLIVFGNNMS